ncbi:hypothetical protein AXG93_3856s1030 [Marchantia polymorpha subsp. ruderalis]|uniref:Uncharacterized protein n=1 Tax=Marchantia polymorpha subsp. ruderalis TaxID=1480154 RepID=A0A176VVZ3_MARPO|nr:hypothetical protein AXG93_3856s1030 [Marchantia polymorpha subsp. ruderalis]
MRLVLHAPRRTSGPAPDTGLCRIGPIGKSARRHLVIGKPARRHHGDAEPRYGKTVAPGVQNYDYGTGREGKGRDGSTFVCHYRDEDYGPELRCVYNIRLGSSLRIFEAQMHQCSRSSGFRRQDASLSLSGSVGRRTSRTMTATEFGRSVLCGQQCSPRCSFGSLTLDPSLHMFTVQNTTHGFSCWYAILQPLEDEGMSLYANDRKSSL